METVYKDPDENLDFTLDFSEPLGVDGDTIATHLVEVPVPGTLVLGSNGHTDTTITAWLSEGDADVDYPVTFRATTTEGRTYERTLVVLVRSNPTFITLGDLSPFTTATEERLRALIQDFEANAIAIAPCLDPNPLDAEGLPVAAVVLSTNQKKLVKAVLRAAILRWLDSDGGALQQQVAGPFAMTVDTRQQRKGYFWPTEVDMLQSVCNLNVSSGAFSVDTWAAWSQHLPWCAINFGALYCSCGVDIAGVPIFELEGG